MGWSIVRFYAKSQILYWLHSLITVTIHSSDYCIFLICNTIGNNTNMVRNVNTVIINML
jgi:hypothetical protein